MSIHTEIDQALHQLGTVAPPPGLAQRILEQRIHRGLHRGHRRLPRPVFFGISGGALAASIALSVIALNPSLHRMLFPQHAAAQNLGSARRVPANGGFGARWDGACPHRTNSRATDPRQPGTRAIQVGTGHATGWRGSAAAARRYAHPTKPLTTKLIPLAEGRHSSRFVA